MVKLTKIYTRTGDDGSTGLVGGNRVSKTDIRVTAYGDIDELNSHLGFCFALTCKKNQGALSEKLKHLENILFDLGAELATPPGSEWPTMVRINLQDVVKLENWIDELNRDLEELRSFVLPGATETNAALHIARTVCRRAERTVLSLHQSETGSVSEAILQFINRVSDLLFVMSRWSAWSDKAPEVLWVPNSERI